MKHPQSPLAARCFAHPLAGGAPSDRGDPGHGCHWLACSAASRLFGFHALRVALSAMDY